MWGMAKGLWGAAKLGARDTGIKAAGGFQGWGRAAYTAGSLGASAYRNPMAAGAIYGGVTGGLGGLVDPNSSMLGGAIKGAAGWGLMGAGFGRYGKAGINAFRGAGGGIAGAGAGAKAGWGAMRKDARAVMGRGKDYARTASAKASATMNNIGNTALKQSNTPVSRVTSTLKPGNFANPINRPKGMPFYAGPGGQVGTNMNEVFAASRLAVMM